MSPNLPAVIAIPEPEREYDGALRPVAQADTDQQLVNLWVRRHESPNTRRNYRRQAERFLAFVNRPLAAVRLGDMQAYLATLDGRAPATRANAVAALKSLFSFAQETGFLRFNVGKAVKSPSVKNTLAERIMPEADMLRLIGLETKPRNRAILTLLYGGGLRISELCGLCWRDLAERQDGAGQATIYGKGGKTRAVLLSANTWRALMSLRGEAGPDEPVFLSREGGRSTSCRSAGSSRRRRAEPSCRRRSRRIGSAIRMAVTAWIGARPSTWCSRPSGMRPSPTRAAPARTPLRQLGAVSGRVRGGPIGPGLAEAEPQVRPAPDSVLAHIRLGQGGALWICG